MQINNGNFLSIEQLQDQYLNRQKQTVGKGTDDAGRTFGDILKAQSEAGMNPQGVKFSKHAVSRLIDRNIALSDEQLERLNDGFRKASEKGIEEPLVLMDGYAFIVNVPNNTVITAMDQTETKENVFTNIDGAVII